jgi:hypothetical protein
MPSLYAGCQERWDLSKLSLNSQLRFVKRLCVTLFFGTKPRASRLVKRKRLSVHRCGRVGMGGT